MTAVVIFAHGSSVESANDAVRKVAKSVGETGGFVLWETAFLEMGKPDLPAAVACLVARGAQNIAVLPYFLTLGIHLQRDLPRIVGEILEVQKGITIEIAPPLDGHPALGQILLDRAKEVLQK